MWRQLSGFEKFRFVACLIGLPAAVVGATLTAIHHQWVNVAIQIVLGVSFIYYLYKFAARGRGQGEPQPDRSDPGTPPDQSSNPTVRIAVILAVVGLAVAGFFGYKHFVKHDSQPITLSADDNSFTVTVSANWRTGMPHPESVVLLLSHDPAGQSMAVIAQPASSTLQELGSEGMGALVNQKKAVIDPEGGLQSTIVDGEAALRCSYMLPPNAKAPSGMHIQTYFVLHRNVQYFIDLAAEPDEYSSAVADFDAIMHSWKWSA